jgi:glycosyltransferase involved in cell wall biosynthesis
MNVAQCIHGLGLGGAQEIVREIARGAPARGFRYFVYSCDDGVLRPRVEAAGATVRILPRVLPRLDPFWVARLAAAMRRDAVAVVHTHLFGDSLHGYLAARAAGALPVVMTLHNVPESFTPLQRRGYRWLLARSSRNVACSEHVRAAFAALPWRGMRPLVTVRNGIAGAPAGGSAARPAAEIRRELGIPPAAPVVAGIGRLVEQKGFADLIRACRGLEGLPGPPPVLLLVGEGPLRAGLERQAAAAGLAGRVVFAGFRPDVPRLLPAADVVAFSSLYEGLPVALLEAMAAGRCVVATALPGIAEAVRDGREALLVPAGDPGRLGAALRRALADPGLRARLGAAARHRFQALFTAERMVASYESLYREAAGEAREAP